MTGVRSQLLILCYHSVSDEWPEVAAVGPATIERQVRHALRRGYVPVTLSEALRADAPRRTLAVTFDDAFASVLERGLPVLDGLGVPATLFVPTDYVTAAAPLAWSSLGDWVGTPHEGELRPLTWDGVRRLFAAGWEIGSHTCSHPNLTSLTPAAVEEELVRSKRACEQALQRPCATLAYPFGATSPTVREAAARAGYAAAVTLGERLLEPRLRQDPLRLSRDGVYRTTGSLQFALLCSPLLGRLRAMASYRRAAGRAAR